MFVGNIGNILRNASKKFGNFESNLCQALARDLDK